MINPWNSRIGAATGVQSFEEPFLSTSENHLLRWERSILLHHKRVQLREQWTTIILPSTMLRSVYCFRGYLCIPTIFTCTLLSP